MSPGKLFTETFSRNATGRPLGLPSFFAALLTPCSGASGQAIDALIDALGKSCRRNPG
jgi:hypothetical protein